MVRPRCSPLCLNPYIVRYRFDIYSYGFQAEEDEKGMLAAAGSINQLIAAEIESSGIDSSRVILGGFSQGATMSLLTGLTGERKLGGLAVLSGWLPLRKKFKSVRIYLHPGISAELTDERTHS
jgi:lysophospholipase-1